MSSTSIFKKGFVSSIVFLVFLFSLFWNLLHREFWRDEIQAWVIARDSSSFNALLMNISYEGKPPGWFSFLFIVSRFDNSLTAFALSYLALVTLSLLFIFSIRLPLTLKLITLSGFYFTYGYTSMAREYVLVLLLLSAWIWNLCRKEPFGLRFDLLIFSLLSTVNLFGCIVALAFYLSCFFSQSNQPTDRNYERQRLFTLSATAWTLVMIVISIPSESHLFRQDRSLFGIETRPSFLFWKGVGFFAQVILPFSSVYEVQHDTLIPSFVGLVIVSFLVFNLPRNQRLFICLAIAGLFLFHIFAYSPFWWHRGIVVILISYSVFLIFRIRPSVLKVRSTWITISLFFFFQFLGSISGLGMEFRSKQPYSNAEYAAKLISEICAKSEPCTLVSDNDMHASAILGYIPGKSIYYLNRNEFGTFAIWRARSDSELRYVEWSDLKIKLEEFSSPVFISASTSLRPQTNDYQYKLFDGSISGDNYVVIFQASDD